MPTAIGTDAPAFRRHQVERALFSYLVQDPAAAPTRDFLVRVKHLLELDRSAPRGDARHAFSSAPPLGKGDHSLFSLYDALLLYVGVQLLDTGVRRKDVVPLVRDLRAGLGPDMTLTRQHHRRAAPAQSAASRRGSLRGKANASASSASQSPALARAFDPTADGGERIFLALSQAAEYADYASPSPSDRRDRVRIIVGLNSLRARIGDDLALTHLVILEIGAAAYEIALLLLEQPERKRGRQARPSAGGPAPRSRKPRKQAT